MVSEVRAVLRVQVCRFPALFLADLDMHPANSFIHDNQVDQMENFLLHFAKASPSLTIFDRFATYKTECIFKIISASLWNNLQRSNQVTWNELFTITLIPNCLHGNMTFSWVLQHRPNCDLIACIRCALLSSIHYPTSMHDGWINFIGRWISEVQSRTVILGFAMSISSFAARASFLKVKTYCRVRKPVRPWSYRTYRLRRPCLGNWLHEAGCLRQKIFSKANTHYVLLQLLSRMY